MLGVQRSISSALLLVMPLPDTSDANAPHHHPTPHHNSNSCHRDCTARRRRRAEGGEGGEMEGVAAELRAHR